MNHYSPESATNAWRTILQYACRWSRVVSVGSSIILHLLMLVILVCATRTPSREADLELFWVSSPGVGITSPSAEASLPSAKVPASAKGPSMSPAQNRLMNARRQRLHVEARGRQRVELLRTLQEESLHVAETERRQWNEERQRQLVTEEARRKAERVRRLREAALRLARTESLQRFQARYAAARLEEKLHHRDITLILQTGDDLTVTATFVSYPTRSRSRHLTKREAKQVRNVVPAMVRTGDGSVESIIRMAREGIYTFIVEPADGGRHVASVALKFDEERDGIRSLGTTSISGKTVVAKILMPEGILWSDDSFFSGTIQDSEGITKYNADAGLVWKEYY